MKRIFFLAAVVITGVTASAQKSPSGSGAGLGLKAGYNWSYVTADNAGISPKNKQGFMLGAFFGTTKKIGLGFRSEVIFSRQGYSFENGGKNSDVQNDYIYLPQLTTFNFGKRIQIQAGAQIGFLLNSKLSNTQSKDSSIINFMNKFDYGFAGGIEVNPVKGVLVGARYNLGLGKLNKRMEQSATQPYPLPFNPQTTDMKNGVIQFFVGYRF